MRSLYLRWADIPEDATCRSLGLLGLARAQLNCLHTRTITAEAGIVTSVEVADTDQPIGPEEAPATGLMTATTASADWTISTIATEPPTLPLTIGGTAVEGPGRSR
jgi:hypothetical protein